MGVKATDSEGKESQVLYFSQSFPTIAVNILLASKACQKLATMGYEWIGTEDFDRFVKILKVSAAAGLDKFNEVRAAIAMPRDVN